VVGEEVCVGCGVAVDSIVAVTSTPDFNGLFFARRIIIPRHATNKQQAKQVVLITMMTIFSVLFFAVGCSTGVW
jgi:hypothetical protein